MGGTKNNVQWYNYTVLSHKAILWVSVHSPCFVLPWFSKLRLPESASSATQMSFWLRDISCDVRKRLLINIIESVWHHTSRDKNFIQLKLWSTCNLLCPTISDSFYKNDLIIMLVWWNLRDFPLNAGTKRPMHPTHGAHWTNTHASHTNNEYHQVVPPVAPKCSSRLMFTAGVIWAGVAII